MKFKPKQPNGAATLHTTAIDYSRFLIEIISPQHINPSLVDKMMIPQIQILGGDSTLSFGLGLALDIHEDDTLFWHWGDNDVFRAFFIISRKRDEGFVYFSNSQMGLSIVKKLMNLTFTDPEILRSWSAYPQYTDPYFVLKNSYNKYGIDSLLQIHQRLKHANTVLFEEFVLNDLGYYALGKGNIDEAITIFQLNVSEYPESWNVYDSLAEAYMKNGDKKMAIANYEKSLQRNPDNKNAAELIKKLKGDPE